MEKMVVGSNVKRLFCVCSRKRQVYKLQTTPVVRKAERNVGESLFYSLNSN